MPKRNQRINDIIPCAKYCTQQKSEWKVDRQIIVILNYYDNTIKLSLELEIAAICNIKKYTRDSIASRNG